MYIHILTNMLPFDMFSDEVKCEVDKKKVVVKRTCQNKFVTSGFDGGVPSL